MENIKSNEITNTMEESVLKNYFNYRFCIKTETDQTFCNYHAHLSQWKCKIVQNDSSVTSTYYKKPHLFFKILKKSLALRSYISVHKKEAILLPVLSVKRFEDLF